MYTARCLTALRSTWRRPRPGDTARCCVSSLGFVTVFDAYHTDTEWGPARRVCLPGRTRGRRGIGRGAGVDVRHGRLPRATGTPLRSHGRHGRGLAAPGCHTGG